MKKLAVILLIGVSAGASAQQVSCQTIGRYTYCSDGSSSQRLGNTTYINPAPQPAPVLQLPQSDAQIQIPPGMFPPPAQWRPQQCGYDLSGRYVCLRQP